MAKRSAKSPRSMAIGSSAFADDDDREFRLARALELAPASAGMRMRGMGALAAARVGCTATAACGAPAQRIHEIDHIAWLRCGRHWRRSARALGRNQFF